jgi:Carbohydrate family 9 binding domain-like
MDVRACRCEAPPPLLPDFAHEAWRVAPAHVINRLWNGDAAPAALSTTARLLWTASHLWVAFECGYTDLDIDAPEHRDLTVERVALWDRDVCEAFIRHPREARADSYKEFEVAPTAQWCDLAIHRPRVEVDWGWNSGMETAAAIDEAERVFRAVMRLPFAAFGGAPVEGEVWAVNLFRISRADGERQYLSYAATGTRTPDFHVPACFVPLVFEGPPSAAQ